MIAHQVKEIHTRENENFSIFSSFVYVIAIIAVIVASIFIIMTFIRGIYNTPPSETFFISVPVAAIPLERPYYIWSEPVKNIIIDKEQDNLFPVPILPKRPSNDVVPQIETLADFNKTFYEQLMTWESKNHILKKEKFIFKCQGESYFLSDILFEENSDNLTADGEKFLQDIVHIFKNLTMHLHQDLKWDIQVSGFLYPMSLKGKISILRNIAFMQYVQKYIGTQKTVTLYISSQKIPNMAEETLCDNNIGLKITPAKNF